jgi:predicted enzyme related to lactoylglutathione lyase
VVQDISRSLDFYKNVLGFGVDYLSGSPPAYAVVYRDEVYIHLCLPAAQNSNPGTSAVFIAVNGVEELWNRVKNEGIEIIDQLAEKDYGQKVCFRVFTIKDPDKNILRIGEKIDKDI